jgi:hypothetical protein
MLYGACNVFIGSIDTAACFIDLRGARRAGRQYVAARNVSHG